MGFLMVLQAFCQTDKFTLDFDEIELQSLLESLEQDYGLLFSYPPELVQKQLVKGGVSFSSQDLLLDYIFNEVNLKYQISQSHFVLLSKPETAVSRRVYSGIITDELTGDALEFANVYTEDRSQGTTTDENGMFEFEIDQVVVDKIYVSYVGYETKIFAISTFPLNGALHISLSLPEDFDDFLVIKDYIVKGIDLQDNGNATRVSPKLLGSLPGQIEPDIYETLKFLPGISSTTSQASDIRIRGGVPDQNLILWEDIPIYHSAHYFGMISALNPYIVEKMDVYRGGFGAEYGGRVAGVIDMRSAKNHLSDSYWGAGINMTHSYIYGGQNLTDKYETTLTVSARSSYSQLYKSPTFKSITRVNQQGYLLGDKEILILPDHITIEDDFSFQDGNINLSTKLSSKDLISVSGIAAVNSFSDIIDDDRRNETQSDSIALSNYGASIKWSHDWSEKLTSNLKAVGTSYDYRYKFAVDAGPQSILNLSGSKFNHIIDRQLQAEFKYAFNNNQNLSGGYHLIQYDIDSEIVESRKENTTVDFRESNSSALHSFYASFKNPISNILGIVIGVRSSYYTITENLYLEPRLNLAYKLNKRFSIHGNYGRYFQFVGQVREFKGNNAGINTQIWLLAENLSIPVQESNLFQVGALFQQSDWVVDVQAFKRTIAGISARSSFLSTFDRERPAIGDADIVGIDVLVKRDFGILSSWLSYSLSSTDYRFREIQPWEFPSSFDQTQVFKISNQLKLKNFEASIGYQYATGVPYTQVTGFEAVPQQNGSNEYTFFYDQGINTERLRSQQTLNASLQYFLSIPQTKKMKLYISTSVSNILNRNNLSSRTFSISEPIGGQPQLRTLDYANLGITPNLSIRLCW